MEVHPTFLLRDPQAPTTSVVMYVRWKGQRVVFGTSQIIDPVLWDNETMRSTKDAKKLRNYKRKDPQVWAHCDRLNSRLDKICNAVTDYFIKAGDLVPKPDELKTHLLREFRPQDAPEGPLTLNEFISRFIQEIATGKRQTQRGTKYAPATVRAFNSFRKRFFEFQDAKRKVCDFDDIDLTFYDRFTSYLTEIGNRPNSTGKQIKCLKAIMRAALDEKLHDNRTFQTRRFKAVQLEPEAIYLTQEELDRITALDLSDRPTLEIARDVFLVGCYTAQRVSDYLKITKENLRPTSTGIRVIDLQQVKTGNRVYIPIKPELSHLLKKYDNTVPFIWEQKLNDRIKEIGKEAGINELVQVTTYRNGKKVLKHVPKYSLITSHTARRTGATLMYLAGIPLLDIAKITGHKTVKELMKYIRVSSEEVANKLATHPYFSPLRVAK